MGERKKSGGDKEGKEAKLDGELECALGEQLELEREAIPIIRSWEKEDKITQPCLLPASTSGGKATAKSMAFVLVPPSSSAFKTDGRMLCRLFNTMNVRPDLQGANDDPDFS